MCEHTPALRQISSSREKIQCPPDIQHRTEMGFVIYDFCLVLTHAGLNVAVLALIVGPMVVLVARKPWAPHGERDRPTLQEGDEAGGTEQCQEAGRADNTRTISGRASRGRSA